MIPEFKIVAAKRNPLPSEMVEIKSTEDVYKYWRDVIAKGPFYRQDVEQGFIVMVNESSRVLGHALIGLGTSDQVLMGTKEVFRMALLANATGFFLIHNHPNNDTEPSEPDKRNTTVIGRVSHLIGPVLIDALIVGEVDPVTNPKGYTSIGKTISDEFKRKTLGPLEAFIRQLEQMQHPKQEKQPEPALN